MWWNNSEQRKKEVTIYPKLALSYESHQTSSLTVPSFLDRNRRQARVLILNNPLNIKPVEKEYEYVYEDVTYKMLLTEKHRKSLFIGCALEMLQQLCGFYGIFTYWLYFGFTGTPLYGLRFISWIVLVCFTLLSLKLLKKIGRTPLLMWGYLVSVLWSGIMFELNDDIKKRKQDSYEVKFYPFSNILITIFILVFMISYSLTIGTTTWVYIAETMPPRALGIAMCFRWWTNALLLLSEWIYAQAWHKAYGENSYQSYIAFFFLFYGGIWIWGYFMVLVYVQETRKLSLQKLKNLYQSSSDDSLSS